MITSLLLLVAPTLGSDEPAPAPPAPPASVAAPARAPAMVIARAADELSADPRWIKSALRCASPGGPSMIYLSAAPSPSAAAAYAALLKWTEARLERQMPEIEAQAGRICFERRATEREVVDAVARDPRSIGVVSGEVAVPDGFVVLWSTTTQ